MVKELNGFICPCFFLECTGRYAFYSTVIIYFVKETGPHVLRCKLFDDSCKGTDVSWSLHYNYAVYDVCK